ncbi:MAG: ATP-binding protein [Gemmatimonadota bacterium]|nr:ATP-binding protein [Gemmatimonadota bacterium]
MQLIRRLEIAYFRSIYKETVDRPLGTTVLFGRNDAGKSNVLRALNLFFNGHTNPGQPFSFERDFCHARRAEADPTKNIRKFVYVKVWFTTPASYRPSLGREFWVRKQWSVTRQGDPVVSHSIGDPSKYQYLTRFLNQVRFHYIPAIKDRRIFEQLLAQIYEVVASQEQFTASLADFAGALQERTEKLTQGLLSALDVKSVISPPDDLSDLFRSLDFETNTEQGDSYSLTLQRGDGIQVRHIPAILAFLSDRGAEDYHIWGFEEPENSLELANAIDEAEQFCEHGRARNKQIFLTSHSPAFFALREDDAKRYFVSRSEERSGRLTSTLRAISGDEAPGQLMGETPHLPVISSYLAEAHGRIEDLREVSQGLAAQLAERDRSILFVEGESDRRVITAAWDVLIGGERPFDIEDASGTTKMESLGRDGQVINRLAPARTVMALVDNDHAGRQLYSDRRLGDGGKWVRHNSNRVYWCRLPFLTSLSTYMTSKGINKAAWPGSLENMFEPALRAEAVTDGALALTTIPHDELLDSKWYAAIQEHLPPSTDPQRFWILRVDPNTKLSFADWIVARARQDPTILEPFRPFLEGLRDELDRLAAAGPEGQDDAGNG